jgi:hypothetical protein
MITLRVIVDQLVAPVPGGLGRYTEELTRSLISTAPTDCAVEGIVSASSPEQYEQITTALPGGSSPLPGSWASPPPPATAWCTRRACSHRCTATTGFGTKRRWP